MHLVAVQVWLVNRDIKVGSLVTRGIEVGCTVTGDAESVKEVCPVTRDGWVERLVTRDGGVGELVTIGPGVRGDLVKRDIWVRGSLFFRNEGGRRLIALEGWWQQA